jgi:hypothetical protein
MKNRIRDNLIVWGVMLVMVGFTIWITLLGMRGIDWVFEKLSDFKEVYFTPILPELAVTACALLCSGYFFLVLWLSKKAKGRHPSAGILCAYGDIIIVALCWTIYLLSSKHMDLSLMLRWFVWFISLGIIAGRLEKDCKIAYVAFWVLFLLSLNEFYGEVPSFSMTGVRPDEKDFLEHHFGLTQLVMLTHAALLLAQPSSIKWIWSEAEKAKAEEIRKIFAGFENREATNATDAQKTVRDMPPDQQKHNNV